METITKLHSDLKSVESGIEYAQEDLRRLESERLSILSRNDKVREACSANREILAQKKETLAVMTEELNALSLEVSKLEFRYSSSLFGYKQIPAAVEMSLKDLKQLSM